MKRKTAYVFALILYLLAVCTILSAKIEEEMQTQAVTHDFKNRSGNIEAGTRFFYYDTEGGTHLFYVEEGTKWVRGNVSRELSPLEYTAGNNANMQPVLLLSGNRDWSLISYASRFPMDGRGVEICSSRDFTADQYLLVYPDGVPEYDTLPDRVSLISQTDHSLILDMHHTNAPFIEERAKTSFQRLESENWKIYSLGDYETFQNCIHKVVLLVIIAAMPVVLWLAGLIWMLISGNGKKPALIFTVGTLLCIGGVMYLITQIDLPSSLMPVESIFDFEYYRTSFQEIERYIQ